MKGDVSACLAIKVGYVIMQVDALKETPASDQCLVGILAHAMANLMSCEYYTRLHEKDLCSGV